jgi:hypothetical protein
MLVCAANFADANDDGLLPLPNELKALPGSHRSQVPPAAGAFAWSSLGIMIADDTERP